jgi:hypothetical protein
MQKMISHFYPIQALHRDGKGHTLGKHDECVMVGATVLMAEFVREHPNLWFTQRERGEGPQK